MSEEEKQDAEDAENEGEGSGTEGEDQESGIRDQDEGEGEGEDAKGAGGAEGDGEPTAIEGLAAEMGWVPKDKWRGDPDKWVEPRIFIRQGDTILRNTLHRQDGRISPSPFRVGMNK